MNHRKETIILTREDLVDFKKDSPIEDIDISDFKRSSVTMDELHKANLVGFMDEGKVKTLKNRFPFTINKDSKIKNS